MIRKHKFGIMLAMLVAAAASAGSIHVWASGEYITATDLNATIAHLHANLGHGHGPVIVNSDISSSASISHAKMATPALLPKAWATLNSVCTGACTMNDSSGVTSVTWVSAGVYTVTFPVRPNANYATFVTPYGLDSACTATSHTTTSTNVNCYDLGVDAGVPILTNGAFGFMLMDTEN